MTSKRVSKCLIGIKANQLWDHFDDIELGCWSQSTFTGPQSAHAFLIWKPFGPHFQSFQSVLASCPGHISFAKYNSQFVQRGSLSKLVDQTSEQNTGIILHNLLFIIREHALHFSFEIPAFKVPTRTSQQHTYTYVQTIDNESLIAN